MDANAALFLFAAVLFTILALAVILLRSGTPIGSARTDPSGVDLGAVVEQLRSEHRSLELQLIERFNSLSSERLAALAETQLMELDHRSEAMLQRVVDLTGQADLKVELRGQAIGSDLEHRNAAVEAQLSELRSALSHMTGLVSELRQERATQQTEFVTRLTEAAETTSVLARSAEGLREALANPKARGSWGERTAEDLLRSAGFVHGVNYRRQQTLDGGGRPDFTLMLPDERVLHLDVKFPADNYLRYVESDNADERERLAKQFVSDVRGRIKELSRREYDSGTGSLDYVVMFIPNESVFGFLHDHAPNMVDECLAQRVILCSPFTLFGVLAVIRQSVEAFRLEERSNEILDCLVRFKAEWERYAARVDVLARNFATTQRTMDELVGVRRKKLDREFSRIEALQAGREDPPSVTPLRARQAGAPSPVVKRSGGVDHRGAAAAAGDTRPDDFGPGDLGPDDFGPEDLGPDDFGPDDFGPDDLGPDHVDGDASVLPFAVGDQR